MSATYAGADTAALSDDGFGRLVTAHARQSLAGWLTAHAEALRADLDTAGAVVLRGFDVPDAAAFGAAARGISPVLLDYLERTAPRTEVVDGVFTSTEMSADRPIGMHHEMSYAHQWPGRVYFWCETPAASGGATPVGDHRTVTAGIPADVRERFERDGVRYVRNYGPFVDLPWQDVFQTTDRAVVELYCRSAAMDFAWTDDDGLRTVARRRATVQHPRTGETVWFNHAHLFHTSSLPPEVVEVLVADLGLDGLPRNTTYGDGAPIEDDVIELLRGLHERDTVALPWQRHDVMVIDNLLVTHGREPFTGERRVLVAMSDLMEEQR